MEISKLHIGHTFHRDSEELSGLYKYNDIVKSGTTYYSVNIKMLGGNQLKEHSDIEAALEFLQYHNLVYVFIEHTNKNGHRKIIVIHNIFGSDKIVGYHNYYGVGGDWKLYINSKSNVVLQHILFPQTDITVRFRDFPSGNKFYTYLSCLIYTVTNYVLKTEVEVRSAFEIVKNHAMKLEQPILKTEGL